MFSGHPLIFSKLHLDVQLLKHRCQETPSQVFVPTLVLEQWTWCPSVHVGGSGTYPSSMIKKVEVVVASKKYLAFTQDDLSAIFESFTPSVPKVM